MERQREGGGGRREGGREGGREGEREKWEQTHVVVVAYI